ncbi:flavin reductase (DIM6/NTAB) family NADH-FMN oxidoreductase RutF [Actinocorallia herbida]|uniref:Flavin reductase (DIM6/NTAB) family NADH-FMN oxidoreductase RutF n=1 Tax=Actinocorallia herbida TaxID=58109 RepID=A0A3N1CNG4_9ACTN|nr:flavin reductase family protein [Actinocorallia herbida]ROO82867.1 flavin reductase (DIM6/NTAB) family NADH-FMN oxidoreductase RutF [Actinocorallia herbida]
MIPPDPAEFRRVAGRFTTGITIVTTVVEGVPHAMTMSAFTTVSLDPLLVLFCAEKKARFHDTVLGRETWAVSILGEHSEAASSWFATRGRPLEGQLDGWATHPGAVTGAPVFDEAIGALECRTHAVHDGGDHSIVVGEVLAVSLPSEGGPLLYDRGAYRALKPE